MKKNINERIKILEERVEACVFVITMLMDIVNTHDFTLYNKEGEENEKL